MGRSAAAAARMASYIVAASWTPLPSLEKAMAPAWVRASTSTRSVLVSPTVMGAMGRTRTIANSLILRLRSAMSSVVCGSGTVFGIAQIVVHPPRAAAAVPEAMVSLCSCPGSRRWTCRSTMPGVTRAPPRSMISASAPSRALRRPREMASIRSSRTRSWEGTGVAPSSMVNPVRRTFRLTSSPWPAAPVPEWPFAP